MSSKYYENYHILSDRTKIWFMERFKVIFTILSELELAENY